MSKFVGFWTFKRLRNRHVLGCIILIALVIAPVVCALVLSDSMIEAMSDKYIYLSSGHLTISSNDSVNLEKDDGIKYSDSVCTGYAMMYSESLNTTLYIKGVKDSYFNEDRIKHIHFVESESLEHSNLSGIVISEYTAELLNLKIGDKVAMMIVPDVAGKTMRPVIVRVEKIYTTGYEAIDSNLAFVSYEYSKTLFHSDDSHKTELILQDSDSIDVIRNRLITEYDVSSWMSSNYSVFSNFVTSKQVIFIILMVVVVMAGFYTASAARLLTEDQMRSISILKMIGANNSQIYFSSLFTMILSTVLGMLIGLGVGLVISFNFSPILELLSKSNISAFHYYLFDINPIIPWNSIINCLTILLFISFISVSFVLKRTFKFTPIKLFTSN